MKLKSALCSETEHGVGRMRANATATHENGECHTIRQAHTHS